MDLATITPRSELTVDTAYYIRKDDQYFITPDGIGGYWFDSIEDLEEEYGPQAAEPEEIEELED